MAYKNLDKFNDPGSSGNPFGGLVKSTNVPGDNGRTPVNPEADKNLDIRVETKEASYSVKGMTPPSA